MNRTTTRSPSPGGDVFASGHLGRPVKVIDFERNESRGGRVSTNSTCLLLATEYHFTSSANPSLFHPSTNLIRFHSCKSLLFLIFMRHFQVRLLMTLVSSAATGHYADVVVALDVPDVMHKRGRPANQCLCHYRPNVPTHARSPTFGFSIVHP
jgi:hypothetical protein